jgi:glycosyltransferase involved in cell wall biosynthesis
MRILVHDFSGHPFQVQLSRHLARRGHEVLHLHCASERTGKGALARGDDDPAGFAVDGVLLPNGFDKYSIVTRWRQERSYGRLVVERARDFAPDVILSANTPLFAQQRIVDWASSNGVGFVFWVQDILSTAMRNGANRRMPVLGTLLGGMAARVERGALRRSHGVVLISEDFRPTMERWGVDTNRVAVVENWAPIDELPELPRDNAWSSELGLDGRRVILYSGTLGMKHDPGLLVALAREMRERPDVAIVVISEGLGADWLAGEVRRHGLTNLLQLPFQPYARLPEVLAGADVLVAILEPDAGAFSVPSKVLTYHCAGRPLLGAIPSANLAARIIGDNRTGLVVDPGDVAAFVAAASRLVDDDALRAELGHRARRYAETTFDIARIGERFEQVLVSARVASDEHVRSLRKKHA